MDEQPSNGSAEPSDNASPFERFERLTKRLVSVPKAEVDSARAAAAKKKPPKRRLSA